MKKVDVVQKRFTDTMYYEEKPVLKYEIYIPKVETGNYHSEMMINRHYEEKTRHILYDYIPQLYHDAVARYIQNKQQNIPFMKTEYIYEFTVSLNKKGFLSLYFDTYLYAGGANADFERCADTWDVLSGQKLELCDFFEEDFDYRCFFIDRILEQVKCNPDLYFENVEDLVRQYFNEKSFYLTDDGFAIFYGTYELGARPLGIPVFIIPFCELKGYFRA